MKRVISYLEAYELVRAPRRAARHRHQRGWYYEILYLSDTAELMNAPVGVDNQIGWDGDIPADGSDDDGRDDGDVEMGNGGGAGKNTPMAGGGRGQSDAGPINSGASVEACLNNVRDFLCQVGGGISKNVLEGSYDALVGYLQGRLDRVSVFSPSWSVSFVRVKLVFVKINLFFCL